MTLVIQEKRTCEVQNWIFSDSTDMKHTALQNLRKGTGNGLLKDARFEDWCDGDSVKTVIWCHGTRRSRNPDKLSTTITRNRLIIAGTGKTILR